MNSLKHHMDKVGILGVLVSHLGCIGMGLNIGFLAPVFSIFALNRKVLLPIILVSLSASLVGIFLSYLKHKNILPLLLCAASSAIIVTFTLFIHKVALLYLGISGLVGASIINIVYAKRSGGIHGT